MDSMPSFNMSPRQISRHFANDIFNCIFLNENVLISIKISLKFITKGAINNISALVHKMAGRRLGDKPLSEPMMVRLPMHIYVTRPQWFQISVRVLADGLEADGSRPSSRTTLTEKLGTVVFFQMY